MVVCHTCSAAWIAPTAPFTKGILSAENRGAFIRATGGALISAAGEVARMVHGAAIGIAEL